MLSKCYYLVELNRLNDGIIIIKPIGVSCLNIVVLHSLLLYSQYIKSHLTTNYMYTCSWLEFYENHALCCCGEVNHI